MKRRELLAGAGWVAAAGAVWTLVPRAATASAAGVAAPSVVVDALLERLCDLVIPDTDTPGARAAGVPAFVALALQHQLAGAAPADRDALRRRLDREAGGAFLGLVPAAQQAVLARVDAASFGREASAAGEPAWARIKQLIVMGYYTSEVGASQELQYTLVPGRWDPDVPVKPGDRGSSSDWTGQTF